MDHVGVSIGFGMGVTHSCLHNNLLTSGLILTKFSLIYNLDIKNGLHFGNLDLIFKVTAIEKHLQWWGRGVGRSVTSLEYIYLFILFLHQNISCGTH